MTAVAHVFRWEITKLLAQKRTYLGLGAAILIPLVFVVALLLQSGSPTEVPLGRYVRETGLVTPFVVLFFMSIWGLPLITALVAGDIVAAESHNGTLKTILTRSRERGEIFAGKALATYSHVFGIIGLWGLGAGLVMIVLSPWLKKLAHGASDTHVQPKPDAEAEAKARAAEQALVTAAVTEELPAGFAGAMFHVEPGAARH